MSTKVQEAADALRVAKEVAKMKIRAGFDELVKAETTEELARLSVELHAAFNAGATKEALRKESRFYANSTFDEAWNAVPYTGRDVKPGRAGAYVTTVVEAVGRYAKQLVTNEDSPLGKGLLVTAFEGVPLPEPLNLPIFKIDFDGLEYQVRDLPYEKRPDGENMPSWWTDITHVPREYKKFAVEANEFIIAEIGV